MTTPQAIPWRYRWALFKSKCVYRYFPGRRRAMRTLYGSMLSPGDLCFDLGSHIGARVDVLTALACRVVAVEPHPYLASHLRRRFSGHPDVVVDDRAVSRESGEATLHWSPRHLTVSSLHAGWLESLRAVRPHRIRFTESRTVRTTTVGALIGEHGVPRYLKIDIEGSDLDVIRSLPMPIDIVSFEHLPRRLDSTAASLVALGDLADYRYNYFVRESHRFRAPAPLSADMLLEELSRLDPRGWSCDIYAFKRGERSRT